jgi:hypothetical protein
MCIQWVWIRKILQLNLNTYHFIVCEKKILVIEAELEQQKTRTTLEEIKHKVYNKTFADFWARKAVCPVCCRHAKEARTAKSVQGGLDQIELVGQARKPGLLKSTFEVLAHGAVTKFLSLRSLCWKHIF